jgi:riboflavin synthase
LIPKNIEKYMVYKGSVAINGVSTTISDINNKTFSVTIIPITLKKTTFNTLKIGDVVNIETDITAKYIEKILLSFDNTNKIDKNLLEVNGFI